MTDLETIQEGVMVYPGAMPPIFRQELEAVISENGADLTQEEAVQIMMYRVGELAARAEKPEKVLA